MTIIRNEIRMSTRLDFQTKQCVASNSSIVILPAVLSYVRPVYVGFSLMVQSGCINFLDYLVSLVSLLQNIMF